VLRWYPVLTIEGNIINTNKVFRGRIEIDESGTITTVGEPKGDADFVFKDELVFPGFIDLHVHARECADHSQDYKEDFKTAGEAAVNGGVVAFCEMPNNPVPPVDDASYDEKKKLTEKSIAEVVLYAGIGPNTKPLTRKVPYKVYMGHSVGNTFFTSYDDLEKALENYRGRCVSFHSEDPKMLEAHKGDATHNARRPKEAEVSAIDFALRMIEKYGLEGKICHLSTKEGLEKIKEARRNLINVSAEVSPHHLYYDVSKLNKNNEKWMQMNPPLREHEDSLALILGLKQGEINFLATDHAPHTKEEKEKGMSGTPQLDTYGPFVTWLMREHGFTPEEIAKCTSTSPALFINDFTKTNYGRIKEGYAGSLTIIDPNKEYKVSEDKLKTKCGWSPFTDVTFPGSVVMTVVKGKVLKNETK
jgi:dihydroorotase